GAREGPRADRPILRAGEGAGDVVARLRALRRHAVTSPAEVGCFRLRLSNMPNSGKPEFVWGEVGARSAPGEGSMPIESPRPLTPTLSPMGRGSPQCTWHCLDLRLRETPHVVDAVAGDVAGLLVVLPEIERLALVGPLLLAVAARHDGPVAVCLDVALDEQ